MDIVSEWPSLKNKKAMKRTWFAKKILVPALVLFAVSSCKNETSVWVAATDPHLMYMGRTGINTDSTATELYWPGASVQINFEGTGIVASLQNQGRDNYYNVIVQFILNAKY